MRPVVAVMASSLLLAACGGDGEFAAKEDQDLFQTGPGRENKIDGSIFGDEGLKASNLLDGSILGGDDEEGTALPVNKYLWQASLDTLSFLPLASTDPFTGVIATDWGATAQAPGERFKVTAFLTDPKLSASSLKVAVYRQRRDDEGSWVPASVSPETARKLEDAILTRARQIRIASADSSAEG
ncbi:MAG: DUF3576 domain-containing protein [Pseudomonadota bacterium]